MIDCKVLRGIITEPQNKAQLGKGLYPLLQVYVKQRLAYLHLPVFVVVLGVVAKFNSRDPALNNRSGHTQDPSNRLQRVFHASLKRAITHAGRDLASRSARHMSRCRT